MTAKPKRILHNTQSVKVERRVLPQKLPRGISGYPIGATWICKDENGETAKITLKKRCATCEIWEWYRYYPGGIVKEFDWNTSKRQAIDRCGLKGRYARQPE